MQQAQPLVSVIIPVYNSRKRLAACLDHVAAMDYPNLEVIIVDDCSTDGSLEICRTYEKKVPYFHVITKKNETGFCREKPGDKGSSWKVYPVC